MHEDILSDVHVQLELVLNVSQIYIGEQCPFHKMISRIEYRKEPRTGKCETKSLRIQKRIESLGAHMSHEYSLTICATS